MQAIHGDSKNDDKREERGENKYKDNKGSTAPISVGSWEILKNLKVNIDTLHTTGRFQERTKCTSMFHLLFWRCSESHSQHSNKYQEWNLLVNNVFNMTTVYFNYIIKLHF